MLISYVVGALIGAILGLTGAGGSVLAVPMLIQIFHLSPHDAMGISLGVVSASAIFGVFTKIRSAQIEWLPAILYSCVGGLFSPLGIILNKQLNANYLMAGFLCIVFFVCLRLWLQASAYPSEAKIVRSSLERNQTKNKTVCNNYKILSNGITANCFIWMSIGAAITGLLSGIFGVGGGFLIVPTLLKITGMHIRQAIATSLVIISLVSLTGFISFTSSADFLDINLFAKLAIGSIFGMLFGILVSNYITGPTLQKVFSMLLFVTALQTAVFTILN